MSYTPGNCALLITSCVVLPMCACIHSCTSSIKYYDEQHCQTMTCAKDRLNRVVWLMPPIFMTFNFTIQSTPAYLLSQLSAKHRKVYTNM